MNQKKVFSHSDNVFWKKENFTMHNVMLGLPNPEPKKLINSIKVEKKHFKSKFITKMESSKPLVKEFCTKNELTKPQVQNLSTKIESSKPLVQISSPKIGSELNKKECTLKDLCKEDKIKITNLIKELAKYGEEKEKALEELQNMKKNFEEKLQILDNEKQVSIRDQVMLKEKLLEYEFSEKGDSLNELDNVKQTSLCESDISDVSHLKNGLENALSNRVHKRINFILPDENTLTEIFHEQQKQFHFQQKRLQDQIEQLQKLQESVVVHQINTKARIQSISPIVRLETEDLKCGLDLTPKEYSIVRKNKLDEYLMSQNKINNLASDKTINENEVLRNVKNDAQRKCSDKKFKALISVSTSPLKDKKEISIQTDTPIETTSLQSKDSAKVNLTKYQESSLNCTISNKSLPQKRQRQSNSQNVLKLVGISSESDEDSIDENTLKNSYANKKMNMTFQQQVFQPNYHGSYQPNHQGSPNILVDCFSSRNIKTCILSKNINSGRLGFSNHNCFKGNKKEDNIDDCKILNDIFFIR